MTGAYAGLVLFDLLALAVGYAWLAGLRLGSPLAGIGFAFFTGWLALGVALALAVSFEIDPSPPQVVAAAACAAAVGLALRRIRTDPLPRPPRDPPRLALVAAAGALLLVVVAVTGLVWAVRSGADPSWDVWAFWEPKAKAVYYFHGFDTGPGGATTFAHPDYPPLVPALIAAQYHFMGGPHASLLRLQQCLLELAFLGTLLMLLRPRVPGWLLYPGVAALAAAPRFWGRLQDVQPDQLLGCIVAVAAVALVRWLDEGRRELLALATLALAAAALTKNEGVLLGVALLAAVALAAAIERRRGALALAVCLLGPLAILPWKWWLARHDLAHVATDYSWSDLLDPGYLADRTHRLVFGVQQMLRFAFDSGLWAWELPLALAALALAAWRARGPAIAVGVWLVLAFAGQATVYWIGRPELHWYVETSAERVIGTLPIVAGSLMPLLLALSLPARSHAPSLNVPGR